jgi:ribosomal protein S15P/S13E
MNKIPEETEEEEDVEAMMAENMRLREHLRKIKADKEVQEALLEVAELKKHAPA